MNGASGFVMSFAAAAPPAGQAEEEQSDFFSIWGICLLETFFLS